MTNLEKRLKDIESEFTPDKKILVATQDPPGSETYRMDGKIYTRAELDALDRPDTILFRVCYESKPLPEKGQGLKL